MKTESQGPTNLNRSGAWLVLLACISCVQTQRANSADNPILLDPDILTLGNIPTLELTIPLENPIGAILSSKHHPLLRHADFSRVSDALIQIYTKNDFRPIWLTANRSAKNLQDLVGILSNAAADGLNPARYDAERLMEWIGDKNPAGSVIASYDVALTVSLLRYLRDLREGQVNPRDIQYSTHIAPKPPLDEAGLLNEHLESQTLTELVSQFEPNNKQYQRLKQILNGLQQLANRTEEDEFNPGRVLRPGDSHPQIGLLRQHLQAMGISMDAENADDKTYHNGLVVAVKKLQHQMGLKADGVIGPATAALFRQSPAEKIAQIELAMERARWIPDSSDGPMILVNIPAFELWAFNSADDLKPLNMKVIVGKSPDNQTPLLWEEMKYLEFMPYWNIPRTIYRKEILPKVAKNKAYLASQDIELVRHQLSEERGGVSYMRARQRPGKKNPLGRVKFMFPNTADVYLHDTPAKTAFNRSRRDLSHGCVRVSEPERLAAFVLGDQKGWGKEAIKQAMSAPKTRRVALKRAVPVLFYYGTTFVDHENQLRSYPDVYGLDEHLRNALNEIQGSLAVNANQGKPLVTQKIVEVAINP